MWHDILIQKLQEHSVLSKTDISTIYKLPGRKRTLAKNEDILRQGDKPKDSVVVLKGMVARYHNTPFGRRQYLSFHMAGDMPDAQAIFLETLDYSLFALDKAIIALVPHAAILALFKEKPNTGFAFWRETLIDASLFRMAITNNSARDLQARIAHFFCELYYRASKSKLLRSNCCELPLSQTQLAETLGASLPSISRALIKLRKTKAVEFKNGILEIKNWNHLVKIADFNPTYLHLQKPIRV